MGSFGIKFGEEVGPQPREAVEMERIGIWDWNLFFGLLVFVFLLQAPNCFSVLDIAFARIFILVGRVFFFLVCVQLLVPREENEWRTLVVSRGVEM